MILIVTRKDDVHADLVAMELEKLGVPFFRLNTEAIYEYEIALTLDGAELLHIASRRRMDTNNISAVYLRRRSIPDLPIDSEYESFVHSEWKSFLKNLWVSMRNARWVSNPEAIEVASNKLAQLKVAQEIGLTIPPTLMTNSQDEVRAFNGKFGSDGLVYKALNSGEISRDSGEVIYTQILDTALLDSSYSDEFRLAPGIFQPCIKKLYEVRVTVIGKSAFSAKIDSQVNAKTCIDWRHYDDGIIGHTAYNLPEAIEAKCIEIVERFGLKFGAIDLIKNDEGYTFLEINANGQWAWIEACTNYPLARAMAKLLTT